MPTLALPQSPSSSLPLRCARTFFADLPLRRALIKFSVTPSAVSVLKSLMLNHHSCSFLGAEARGQKRVFIEGFPCQNACPCFSSTMATNPSQCYSPPMEPGDCLSVTHSSTSFSSFSNVLKDYFGCWPSLHLAFSKALKGNTAIYGERPECVRVTACLHYFKCQAFIFSYFLKKTVEKELHDYSGLCGPIWRLKISLLFFSFLKWSESVYAAVL